MKKLFKKGSLKKGNIKDIADCMGVREEYDKHKDKEDFSLIATFESMLDAWYEAFEDSPPTAKEAQGLFLGFLKDTHCVALVINEVQNAFKSKLRFTKKEKIII